MKQQKLTNYRPNYPRKPLRSAALTGLALVAIAGAAGCQKPEPQVMGMMEILTPPPEELVLDGEVAIAEPTEEPMLLGKIAVTEPPEEVLVTDGEVAIPDPTEEELVLDGDVCIPEAEPTPEVPLQTTGVLLVSTDTPEA